MAPSKKTRQKTTSFYVTISMAFILFLLLIFGMAIMRLDEIYAQQKEKIEIDVFFRDNAKISQIKKVEKELSLDSRINTLKFIPKEKAWENLKNGAGKSFAEGMVDGIPLENSINLTLKKEYVQLDSVELFEKQVNEKYEDVISEIYYSKAHFEKINSSFYSILWGVLGFCSLLIIIAMILINNTIRLAIFSKRFLIRTMQFVGAKHSFIKKPFLVNSVTQGIMSALLAILLYISLSLLIEKTDSPIGELVFKPENMKVNLMVFGIVIGIGILVSYISTYFSLKKYLKLSQDKLYKS